MPVRKENRAAYQRAYRAKNGEKLRAQAPGDNPFHLRQAADYLESYTDEP